MSEEIQFKEKKVFNGTYRNVSFSFQRFDGFGTMEQSYSWTHYIHLNLDKQIKDAETRELFWLTPRYDDKNRVHYDYYSGIIGNIEFHGGCTWYSKESSIDDKDRCIKIGCDYQHSWDVGREYDENYVFNEVKKTIDSLLEITPIRVWCSGCGTYYDDVTKNGCGKCKYSKDKY